MSSLLTPSEVLLLAGWRVVAAEESWRRPRSPICWFKLPKPIILYHTWDLRPPCLCKTFDGYHTWDLRPPYLGKTYCGYHTWDLGLNIWAKPILLYHTWDLSPPYLGKTYCWYHTWDLRPPYLGKTYSFVSYVGPKPSIFGCLDPPGFPTVPTGFQAPHGPNLLKANPNLELPM